MWVDGEKVVARFYADVEVSNQRDVVLAEAGILDAQKVRRAKISGLVDTGASGLVLPAAVAKQLGLAPSKKVKVTYADGRTAVRNAVDNVQVTLLGRSGVFTAAVEPKRDKAIIGAVVLEELDLIPDPKRERLMLHDPKYIITEIG